VAVIVQPGGSVRDKETIAKADELGVAMVFTGERHFLPLTIDELSPLEIPGHAPSVEATSDHPMRIVTRQAAGLDAGGWNPETRRGVQ
jgi:hypothetical protein